MSPLTSEEIVELIRLGAEPGLRTDSRVGWLVAAVRLLLRIELERRAKEES